MNMILPFVVGWLAAAGLYMMLRRSAFKLLIGMGLVSHAANLLIFAAGGLTRGRSPIIEDSATVLSGPYADPLPQALILTAIVINFGLLAFAIALMSRAYREMKIEDLDELKHIEE